MPWHSMSWIYIYELCVLGYQQICWSVVPQYFDELYLYMNCVCVCVEALMIQILATSLEMFQVFSLPIFNLSCGDPPKLNILN